VDLFLRYREKRGEMGGEVAGSPVGIGNRTHCFPLRMMISFRELQEIHCFRQHHGYIPGCCHTPALFWWVKPWFSGSGVHTD